MTKDVYIYIGVVSISMHLFCHPLTSHHRPTSSINRTFAAKLPTMIFKTIPTLFTLAACAFLKPATAAPADLDRRVMIGKPLSDPCCMYASWNQAR